MESVDGIGFDLDHTLAIDNRLERVALLRLLEHLLELGGRTIGTLADEINRIDDLLARQRHGEFSIDEAVSGFVSEHGVPDDPAFAEWFRARALAMVSEFVVPLPGVRATINALRERGIAVAVLTNGWCPLQQRKAGEAGFSGPVLVSSEIGERKPSAAAFARLLKELATAPDRTWYVGDSAHADVAGAQQAGLQAVWFNWERHVYPPELTRPQHTIESFGELLALLPETARAS